MFTKNTPSNDEPRPLESEIAHLFSYALGVVAGFNAAKPHNQQQPFEDLPQGYSFAGGLLDSFAGDLALRVEKSRWFLIEMKRDLKEIRTELKKDRAQFFIRSVAAKEIREPVRGMLVEAKRSHQFLYLGQPKRRSRPELAALSYFDWANHVLDDGKLADLNSLGKSFSSYLDEIYQNRVGFTIFQLTSYIEWLNSEMKSKGLGSLDFKRLLAVATDSTGGLDLIAASTVTRFAREYVQRPKEIQIPSHTQGSTGPRPRLGG